MKEKIILALVETMGIDSSSINENTAIKDIEGFDSLQFVMFISELEETYRISIPVDVALDAETIGDLISCAEGE